MVTGHDLAIAIRRAYMAMHRQTNATFAALGATADQFVVLAILDNEDGITQQEIARRAGSDANTISAMLVRMQANDLLTREPHDSDGRARRVVLTPRGRETYERLSVEAAPLQEAIVSPFEDPESRTLIRQLRQITEAVKRWEEDRRAGQVDQSYEEEDL